MSKNWILVLDESGSFSSENRYFVLAGVLYKKSDLEILRQDLENTINNICEDLGIQELHSKEMHKEAKEYMRNILFYNVGHNSKIKSIIYVVDLKNTWLIEGYEMLSYKYNKCIEWLYRDLIRDNLIDKYDNIYIFLDKVTFSSVESKNIEEWLTKQIENIKRVYMIDSKKFKLVQLADSIANFIPKNGKLNCESIKFKVLDSYVGFFPRRYKKEYFIDEENHKS